MLYYMSDTCDMKKGQGGARCRYASSYQKAWKGAAMFNIPIRWTNRHQQYISLHIVCTVEDLEFNPGIFGTEISNWGSIPPFLLIIVSGRN